MSKISISLLKDYKNDFDNEKAYFNSIAYNSFDSGYLKKCSDSNIIRMKNNLQNLYDKIQKGYENINTWWTNYNNDIENLERVLSDNGSSGSIKESSLRNYVTANLQKLNNYTIGFADVISLNFDNELGNSNLNFDYNNFVNMDASTIKLYISMLEKTEQQLTKDIESYEKKYISFMTTYKQNNSGLVWYNGCYCTPAFMKDNPQPDSAWLRDCCPGTEEYEKALDRYYKWVDEEYTKIYNDAFKKEFGMTLKEYNEHIDSLNQDLVKITSSRYAIRQQEKLIPYLEISETDEYKNYIKNSFNAEYNITIERHTYGQKRFELKYKVNGQIVSAEDIDIVKLTEQIKSGKLSVSLFNFVSTSSFYQNYDYLTEENKKMYSYLYATKGKTEADSYLDAIKDSINEQKGRKEAESFIKSISSENGEIQRNILTGSLTAGKGVLDGIETFGEGLNNVFHADGVMTDNQYAQMYILQALGEKGLMDDAYQLGSAFGNMAPSMAASIIVGTINPAAGSIVGNTLMGLSSTGNAVNQKLIEGKDKTSAYIYGSFIGVSETTLGLLLGNIGFLNSNATLSIKGLLSEGAEEFIQTYVEAGLNAAIYGEKVDASQLFGEAGKSFIYGIVMSGITTSGKLTLDITLNNETAHITNMNDFCEFVSLINSSNMTINKSDDGTSTFVINDDSHVEENIISKIQKIFPDAPIIQNFSDGTSTVIVDVKTTNDTKVNEEKVNSTEIKDEIINEVKNDNSNQTKKTLDEIMNKMGDSSGRRNLLLYAANGNIEHIPVEFRETIKNVSSSEIKNYLGVEDTKIGAQFFGGANNNPVDLDSKVSKNPLITEFQRGDDAMGGNQGSILDKFKKIFKSSSDKIELQNLEATARKYYPNITKQELSALYTRINETGCTYVATANSIFEQLNYDAELFKQKFGFDMYLPNGKLNHDQLILDIYASLDTMSRIGYTTSSRVSYSSNAEAVKQMLGIDPNTLADPHNLGIDSLCYLELDNWRRNNIGTSVQSNPDGTVTIIKNNPESHIIGTPNDIAKQLLGTDLNVKTESELLNILKSNNIVINNVDSGGPGSKLYNNVIGSDVWLNAYFEKNGIELKADISCIKGIYFVKDDVFYSEDLINTLVAEYNKGASITVSAVGGHPIDITDGTKLGHQMLGTGKEGHAMIFRGVTPDGDVIVSSWGKYFLLESEFLSEVNFSITNIKDTDIQETKINGQSFAPNSKKEYSPYSIEQLMEDKNYQKACNLFLDLVTDEKTKSKLEDILYRGGHGDFSISSNNVNADNSFVEAQRRLSMANLLINNPETFDILVENNINLFHGTNANALPSILKYGLNSGAESKKLGISITTGEVSTRINGNQRDFVSFTDVLDIAEEYSGISPELVDNDLSFNVVIGTTVDDVKKAGTHTIHSDTPELGVKNKLPLESIKIIGVPSDKVDFVKKMVVDDKIKVVAIDNLDNRFYYADYDSELLEIYPEEFTRLKETLNSTRDVTNSNSILDSVMDKMGSSAGRRNLLLYAANGNIDRIPVEFREVIKDVSPSEIKNYLGVEDTKIGAQFFGGINKDKSEFITQMCDDYYLDYNTHDKSIIDSIWNMANNDDIPNTGVKTILKNFDLLKKNFPRFEIYEDPSNDNYFDGRVNALFVGSKILDTGVEGTSSILGHEIGHTVLHFAKGDPSNIWKIELSDKMESAIISAQYQVQNNSNLELILKFLSDGMELADKKAISWYDNGPRQMDANKITQMVAEAFGSSDTNKLTSIADSAVKLTEIKQILKDAGMKDAEITSIIQNRDLVTAIAIESNAISRIDEYFDILTADYSNFGVHKKLQSMLNAVLQSHEPIEMSNGQKFNFTYGHDNSYWNEKGNPNLRSYDELFADFFSLQAHGQGEALEMFKEMVGEELYNQLDKECDEIAEILFKDAVKEGN